MESQRILITGGTGLIGRELQFLLCERRETVLMVSTHDAPVATPFLWAKGSLFDSGFVHNVMRDFRPTHLLNLAWCTSGDYLTNDVNYRFLEAGKRLADEFVMSGGVRAVYAGTCFEYNLTGSEDITEDTPLDPEKNAYTHCKNELRASVEQIFDSAGVSFAYGRIFYVYGRNEAKTRLTGSVIDKLRHNEIVVVKSGPLVKDYIYSRDVAGAILALLNSKVRGAINICTGTGISIRDYVMKLAIAVGRPDLVRFNDDCASQPKRIVGNNFRLRREVGYALKWSVDDAVKEIVAI